MHALIAGPQVGGRIDRKRLETAAGNVKRLPEIVCRRRRRKLGPERLVELLPVQRMVWSKRQRLHELRCFAASPDNTR